MARYAKVVNGVVVEIAEQEPGFYQAIDGGEHSEWVRVADTPGSIIEINLAPITATQAINPATGKPFDNEELAPESKVIVRIDPATGEFIDETPIEEVTTEEPFAPVVQVTTRNWANVGYVYDQASGTFRPPRLYASWTYDESSEKWVPPVSCPGDDFVWNENAQVWVKHPKQIFESRPEPTVDEQPGHLPLPADFSM